MLLKISLQILFPLFFAFHLNLFLIIIWYFLIPLKDQQLVNKNFIVNYLISQAILSFFLFILKYLLQILYYLVQLFLIRISTNEHLHLFSENQVIESLHFHHLIHHHQILNQTSLYPLHNFFLNIFFFILNFTFKEDFMNDAKFIILNLRYNFNQVHFFIRF